MAGYASSPIILPKFPLSSQLHHSSRHARLFTNTQLQIIRRSCQIISYSNLTDSPPKEKLPTKITSTNVSELESKAMSSGFPEFPDKGINRRVALISILGASALFISTRLELGVSLKDISAAALPYEEALSNGNPTVVEFYADWCEVCRELAPDVYQVEQQYKDRVNFVMLNVDNTKWEQELDEFGVEGIPHFAFLDKDGNEEGNIVGRFPRKLLMENMDALASGDQSIPHSNIVGQFSSAQNRRVKQVVDPRAHGG